MTSPLARALIAGGCLLVGGVVAMQGYMFTLDPTEAVEIELVNRGWAPSDYEVRTGGYEGFFWRMRAHGEFLSTRADEPGRLHVTIEKTSPLQDWRLVSFEFLPDTD